MRPTYAHCNSCRARIQLFSELKPDTCPKCSSLMRYEEFGSCEKCNGKVPLGVQNCVPCRMSSDPQFGGDFPASGPHVQGGIN